MVLAILAIGAVFGWGYSAVSGDPTTLPADTPTTTGAGTLSADDSSGTVNWVEATDVPAFPDGHEYLGTSTPVEFDGSIYLTVRFLDPASDTIRNELWSSPDGLVWENEPIETNTSLAAVELTATRTGLILTATGDTATGDTATGDGAFSLWRTPAGGRVEGDAWTPLDIQLPAGLEVEHYSTVVNDAGEVVTAVIGRLEIWRDVVAPLVPASLDFPASLDPTDPALTLSGDSVITGTGSTVQLFAEPPEVLTTGSSIWVRMVTLDGDEIIRSYDLPTGAHPVDAAPQLGCIRVAMMWTSPNGIDFSPVQDGRQLPCGYFLPMAWNDGFIAAAYEHGSAVAGSDEVRLWRSDSGREWESVELQPPAECSRVRAAAGDGLILLTDEDGTRCLGSAAGDWSVLGEPSEVGYSVGGHAGFIGYPKGFDYGTAMFSTDGRVWSEIPIPALQPYPAMVPLEDCLLMLSANQADPTLPKHMDIWIGEIV